MLPARDSRQVGVYANLVVGCLAAGCLLWVSGCDSGSPAAAPPVRVHNGKPLTTSDGEQFGESLLLAIDSNDPTELGRLFDFDALVEAAGSGLDTSAEMRQGVLTGLRQNINQPGGILAELLRAGTTHGVRVLRVSPWEQGQKILLRVLLEPAVMYLEVFVARRPTSELRVVDFSSLSDGERSSQLLRTMLIPLAAHENRSLVARLTDQESVLVQNLPIINQVNNARQQGNHAEVLRLLGTLPRELRETKGLMLLRLASAPQVGDAQYTEVMAEMRRLFPREPGTDFISIDYHIIREEYAQAVECMERMREFTANDPYLDVLRANALLAAQDLPAARAACEQAIAAEPTLTQAWYSAIDVALAAADFVETHRLLTELHRRFDVALVDFSEVPAAAGFVASPEYAQWIADLEKQGYTAGPAPVPSAAPLAEDPFAEDTVSPSGESGERSEETNGD